MDSLKILICDDDKKVHDALDVSIKQAYPNAKIFTAENGLEGWNVVQKEKPDIVLSDFQMPTINGIEFLKRIRGKDEFDYLCFIIMTGSNEKMIRMQALDIGADDFLTKPFDNDILHARIKSTISLISLKKRLKEENSLLIDVADQLEQDVQDMLLITVKLVQARIPSSFELHKRVARASVWIAKQLQEFDNDEIRDIEIAGHLCQSGKIFLPDNLINTPVLIDGQATDKLMYQVPVTAREIVSRAKRFSKAADILYNLYENFDGSGFPNRKQSWQIPIGARIVRVALDFEILRVHKQMRSKEIIDKLSNDSNRLYDNRVIVLMQNYIRTVLKEELDPNEIAVQIHELKPGMKITREIITNKGIKLLPGGTVLTENHINKLLNINTSDPILGFAYIRKSLSL